MTLHLSARVIHRLSRFWHAGPRANFAWRPSSKPAVLGSKLLGLAALSLCCSVPTLAQTRALLVGVSGYPSLAAERHLRGPANDVVLIRESLLRAGISAGLITTLADGVAGSAALPTKRNILSALRQSGEHAKPGDWVIVYFSGHGAQQPQPAPSRLPPGTYIEPDGLDEIFLPYDIGRWADGKSSVEGALIDDEIGREFARITARGVRVWAIFDTCHAGDMAKGIGLGSDAPVSRYVPAASLGVPQGLLDAAHQRQADASRSRGLPGSSAVLRTSAAQARPGRMGGVSSDGLVIFYASQPDEQAAEEHLVDPNPSGPNAPKKRYFGLFTYVIAQAMPTWSGSFRQLANKVAAGYRTRPFPTPVFEGDIDAKPNFR